MWGMGSFPAIVPTPVPVAAEKSPPEKRGDTHLQSTRAITGYHIQAIDGMIGEVSDLLLHAKSWAICDLVVETGHLFAGKEIRITSSKVNRISFDDSSVFVSLTMEDIRRTGDDEVAKASGIAHGSGNFRD